MSDGESGGMTAIVAIVAIIVILGVGYVLFQNYFVQDSGSTINVELPTGQE